MKIWIKVVIAGVLIFFAGGFMVADFGINSGVGSAGLIVSLVGLIISVVGILAALQRGYRRMMRE